jgi:hypothetical protein
MSKNRISQRLVLDTSTPGVGEALTGCSGDNGGSLVNRYFDMCPDLSWAKMHPKR